MDRRSMTPAPLPPGYVIITVPNPRGYREKVALRVLHNTNGQMIDMSYVPVGFTPGNAPLTRRKRSEIVRDVWMVAQLEEADALRAENDALKAELARLTQGGGGALAS